MPKKTKNRSGKQQRYERQARARAIHREEQINDVIAVTAKEWPAALAAGAFTILTQNGALKVTLDEMRQRINAAFASDNEPPLDGLDELEQFLTDEMAEGNILCLPNGLWRFPEEYLPNGEQA